MTDPHPVAAPTPDHATPPAWVSLAADALALAGEHARAQAEKRTQEQARAEAARLEHAGDLNDIAPPSEPEHGSTAAIGHDLAALFAPPALADVLDPETYAVMLAAGEDPETIDLEGRTRPLHPLPPLETLALLRLAATLGDAERLGTALRPGAVTLIDTGGPEVVAPLSRVILDRLLPGLPEVVTHPGEAGQRTPRSTRSMRSTSSGSSSLASASASGASTQVRTSRSGAEASAPADAGTASALVLACPPDVDHRATTWSTSSLEAKMRATLASPLPLLAVLTEPRNLDADLRAVLPAPVRLAPLDREIALALLATSHSATGRVNRYATLARLPSNRGLARLSDVALLVALREPTSLAAAAAMARLAGETPQGLEGTVWRTTGVTGVTMDGVADRASDGASAGTSSSAVSGAGPVSDVSSRSAVPALPAVPTLPARSSLPNLDDLAGMGELERVGRLIVDDLAAWDSGAVPWSDVTRSVLFHGEPGTGKTFAAQAIARTANCTFVSTSLAQMQARGHLGDLLKALLGCFSQARASAPSIVFIDEIDAFGSREDQHGRNATYHAQVIAALLEQLDGVEGHEGVVVIAACNDLHRIDPAIRRPGRFDLTVEVPRPGPAGSLRVLRHHLARDLAEGRITDAEVAALLPQARGRTPAEIDAAVRGARSRARGARRPLGADDVAQALAPALPVPPSVIRRTALHETGHAVVAAALGIGRVTRLTITAGGGGLAEILSVIREGTLADRQDALALLLAGREAERMVLGGPSSGAGGAEDSDLARATMLATAIETSWGLGASGPHWTPADGRRTDALTRERVEAHLAHGEARAAMVLAAHRATLERLADLLAAERVLEGAVLEASMAEVAEVGRSMSGSAPGEAGSKVDPGEKARKEASVEQDGLMEPGEPVDRDDPADAVMTGT